MRHCFRKLIRKRTRVRIQRVGFLTTVAAALTGIIYALVRFPKAREFAVILLVSTVLAIWMQIMEERSGNGEEENEA